MKFELNIHNKNLTDEEILLDIKNVSQALGKDTVSMSEYREHGKYNTRNITKRFGKWNTALERAGLKVGLIVNLSDERLFKNLEEVWVKLGRQPTRREMVIPLSKISSSPYTRRFGSWNNALRAFIDYVNEDSPENLHDNVEDNSYSQDSVPSSRKKRTKREISDRLRFRILMRDGFTCSKCGRSPMKERGVELHVDHIIPWSKGGETVPENLETKCAKCNLGKGNAFNV